MQDERPIDLRSIVDSSPAIVCLWRVADDWPVEFISNGISQFGYTPEELRSGKVSFRDFILPEDMVRLEAEVAQHVDQGVDEYTQEYRISTKSGEMRWVEDRNIVIRDSEGQVTHVQGMILDITDRKRMEIALRDSEASLNTAQEVAHMGSWRWDLRTEMFSMSDETLRIHGLSPGASPLDVQAVMAMVYADDRAQLGRIMEGVMAGGEGQEVSFRIVRPDGDIRWLVGAGHTVTQRGEDGRPIILVGTVQDITKQRAARIALQQSEEKYRVIVESTGEAICMLNADGVFLFNNTISAQLLGGTPDEVVGKTLWDVFSREFADQEAIRLREAIVSGKGSRVEILAPVGDEMRWHEVSMEPVRDHDGQVHSVLVIARNVHDQKTAAIALQVSEEHLQAILTSLNQTAIFVYGLDGEILSCLTGPDAKERYGIDREALVGKCLRDAVSPEMADARLRSIRDVCRTGQSVRDERLIVLPNREFWVETTLSPLLDTRGNVVSVVAFAHDVTERKQAEDRLMSSERRYRTLFEGASDGILVADIETHRYMLANPAVCEMLKYSVEELLEMTIADCHPPEDISYVVSCFQAQTRGDYIIAPAIPFRRRDGEVVYADVAAASIRIEGRDCMLGFIHDLTDARKAQEALKTAHMKLVTARDEERRHIASELHDSVGQELTALSIRLNNIAVTGAKLPAEQCSELLKAAIRCNELIVDIRQMCHGLYPPALKALGLVSAMKQFEGHCQSVGLTAAVYCHPGIERTRFGPEVEIALFRIAQEAVNNAIRHSRGTNIDIDLTQVDGELVLAIIDDGDGFDVKAAAGTGLGLSSIRDRALAIGAKLTITSEPGETRIEVSLAMDLEETNEESR